MKIGLVCPYYIFRHGGVQEHVLAVADELRKRGHTVKIVTPTPPDGGNKDPKNVITLGRSTIMNGASSFELSASAGPTEIDDMLEAENFDILHYHEPMLPLLAGQILSRSTSINVATFHAYKPDDIKSKSLNLIYLPYHRNRSKYVNSITAVSDAAAVYVRKATDEDITIIPNGIQLAKFDPGKVKKYRKYDDDIKTILYVGRLEKRKGVEYLLKAYEELKEDNPDSRLVITGEGPKLKALKTYVEQYAIEDVHFLGFVSEKDKLSLLKTCDVFCSPALFGESFGIVLLEAMAMGAPVVAGDNPGYASVMKEKGRLSIVNPKHLKDFARRLELFMHEEDLRNMLIKWGLEYVKQYDYSHITDSYLKIYKDLLSEDES